MAHKTISSAIVAFIESYSNNIKVDTNHLADGADKYGLFKSPSRTLKNRIDKSYEATESYQFFLRLDAINNSERKENEELLEHLQYWLDDYGYKYEYPELTDNRKIINIEANGIPYPMESNAKTILYQMSLTITYERERED